MSYLNNVRLVFSGTFQADVSTVNNDVRHFDNATFEPRFQELQTADGPLNGWFNPIGSGAFRLLDCRVTAVHYADGTSCEDREKDPAVGMLIGGSTDRVSGKIVDLDPQWQVASQLWGLEVRLTDGKGLSPFGGHYRPHAFRDLLFTRMVGKGGDGGASSVFQSVLENVTWANVPFTSRFLEELRRTSREGRLSVRLTTFGYVGRPGDPRYTLGFVSGVIGPDLEGEPESFVPGRRFTPANGTRSWLGINFFNALVDVASQRLLLDFSNALPLKSGNGQLFDIGELSVGVLKDPDVGEKDPLHDTVFTSLGTVPYLEEGWLMRTGGIHAIPLPSRLVGALLGQPLALAARPAGSNGWPLVAIRESKDGLFVCAEPLVHRVDGEGQSTATLYATQYGQPLPQAPLVIQQTGRTSNVGGSGDPSEVDPPKAPIPDYGVPLEAVQLPSTLTTDAQGRAQLVINTRPPHNPRGYLDGQLYTIDYRIQGQADSARNPFDFVSLHLRDAYDVPAQPVWTRHIKPILEQYGNLYPIMSQRLVNLTNALDVERHRAILELAFSLDVGDPNYMPVTRDLSEARRRTLLTWLRSQPERTDATFIEALVQARQEASQPKALDARLVTAQVQPSARLETAAQAPEEDVGGKSRFARSLARARGKPQLG
ncbi:MAG TPA: hypothetical protein VK458_25880 [Myxococcaceae bacterium]|nr:hypothetical protein [Myxococcaceae bacterium]